MTSEARSTGFCMQLHADLSESGDWSYDQSIAGFSKTSPGPSMPSPGESGYDPFLMPTIGKGVEGLFGVIDTAIKGPTVFRKEQEAKIQAEKAKIAQWEAMAAMAQSKKQSAFQLTPRVLLIGGGAAILLIALLAR